MLSYEATRAPSDVIGPSTVSLTVVRQEKAHDVQWGSGLATLPKVTHGVTAARMRNLFRPSREHQQQLGAAPTRHDGVLGGCAGFGGEMNSLSIHGYGAYRQYRGGRALSGTPRTCESRGARLPSRIRMPRSSISDRTVANVL
jgi:hypothetical protein